MVAAYGDDERRHKASNLDALEFITKPAEFDALKRAVAAVIRRGGLTLRMPSGETHDLKMAGSRSSLGALLTGCSPAGDSHKATTQIRPIAPSPV
jgi:hypothetical protein